MVEGITQRSIRVRIGMSTAAAIAMTTVLAWLLVAASPIAAESGIPRSERPEAAQVYFISPADGDTLASPIIVRFGLSQMGVAPAGVEKAGTGHHHLIVDAEPPPIDLPVPASDQYRHFGKGQTQVTLELPPGKHTLQLLLADHIHVPHAPPVMSERITITITD